MKTRIHVNRHVIAANKRDGGREPVLSVKTYKQNERGNRVAIYDDLGNEVAAVVYSPDKPLNCGATVWIETTKEVRVT